MSQYENPIWEKEARKKVNNFIDSCKYLDIIIKF
jgi:hypothetical protein